MSRPLPNGGLADLIAQTIRRVDGNHTLSAGALGEAIAEEIDKDTTRWLTGIFTLYTKDSLLPVKMAIIRASLAVAESSRDMAIVRATLVTTGPGRDLVGALTEAMRWSQ